MKLYLIVGTIIAIVWQVENWRGRHVWEAIVARSEVNGESLDWRWHHPTPIPDHLNAAKHPVFEPAYKRDASPEDADSEKYPYLVLFSRLFDPLTRDYPHDFGRRRMTSLDQWQQLLRSVHSIDWSKAPASNTAAEDVLWGTRAWEPIIEGLKEAFERPQCQWFPVEASFRYQDLGHIHTQAWATEGLRKVLYARALAYLEMGDTAAATDEILVALQFADLLRQQVGTHYLLQRASESLGVFRDLPNVLTHPNMDTPALQRIGAFCDSIDLLGDYVKAVQTSRNANLHWWNTIYIQEDSWAVNTLWGRKPLRAYLIHQFTPRGWQYQNMTTVYHLWQNYGLAPYDEPTKRIDPGIANRGRTIYSTLGRGNPYTWMAYQVVPNYKDTWKRVAESQTHWDLLAVLCKLYTEVSTTGSFPQTLEELPPLPHDYVTGKPPHYEHRENGSMVLASLDWDQTGDPDTFSIRLEIP